jgi:hypothetical protein
MSIKLRTMIVIAAMILGAFVANGVAEEYYSGRDSSGEAGIGAASSTIVVFIPVGAITFGALAVYLTRADPSHGTDRPQNPRAKRKKQ